MLHSRSVLSRELKGNHGSNNFKHNASAFASLEEIRRDAAFAAGRSTSVFDVEADRLPVGEARKLLDWKQARVAALEERLSILTHHCSSWGRETHRSNNQVKAALAMAALHPHGTEHHGQTFAKHYIAQQAEIAQVGFR